MRLARPRLPVMRSTSSLHALQVLKTFSVVQTSMPASTSSRASCQRLGWREPGALGRARARRAAADRARALRAPCRCRTPRAARRGARPLAAAGCSSPRRAPLGLGGVRPRPQPITDVDARHPRLAPRPPGAWRTSCRPSVPPPKKTLSAGRGGRSPRSRFARRSSASGSGPQPRSSRAEGYSRPRPTEGSATTRRTEPAAARAPCDPVALELGDRRLEEVQLPGGGVRSGERAPAASASGAGRGCHSRPRPRQAIRSCLLLNRKVQVRARSGRSRGSGPTPRRSASAAVRPPNSPTRIVSARNRKVKFEAMVKGAHRHQCHAQQHGRERPLRRCRSACRRRHLIAVPPSNAGHVPPARRGKRCSRSDVHEQHTLNRGSPSRPSVRGSVRASTSA
jgi:hypothetical protein